MKAVILAAGEGTRMRPLTASRPKVMLPLANKPMLEHVLNACIQAGINDFVVVTGYKEETVKTYFGDGRKWQVNINYVTQEKQLGTAHAIGCAREFVHEPFVQLNGDMLVDPDHLKKLMQHKEPAVISVKSVDNPSEFGVIVTEENKVIQIIEKPTAPPANTVNAGIYLFDPVIFEYIDRTQPSPRKEYEITDSMQLMVNDGMHVGFEPLSSVWLDVGRPWDMLDANKAILEKIKAKCEGTVEPLATLHGDVVIGEGTIVRNGAYIIGPVVIGKNCDIGPNCFIRPSTSVGNNVHIGNGVEVKNCVIMDGTKIGHLTYIGDSVIGYDCNFGAGTKVANLRHDGKNIKSVIKGKKVDTGRRKLGVIMGDNVHTGINTSINVGVVIESGSGTKPGEVLMH
ncbi:MAG: NTP transferase domain-containing protein [Methanomethylovorans sp.]|jgi:bifunctional UDP-N-acetylglucosamine pyrophosphorylase/glucosamine-1-phosphate N-acetyltransferase|nr:NTP transferase domain-containing protein [Methanomethylovorans sp.]